MDSGIIIVKIIDRAIALIELLDKKKKRNMDTQPLTMVPKLNGKE